jgi:non-specific serine/threonine protein kinase
VCSALGLREEAGRSAVARLIDYLRERELLLVLDNCEHLIGACAALADDLVRACPGIVLLATSRQALGIEGEHAYRVPSLAVPSAGEESLDAVLASDAVRLIRERARQHDREFELDAGNAALASAVVRQLDGMPLALELAAARLRSMSIADVHERLDQRFRLLTRGSRTATPRQQTLRATVDWSYELLDGSERELLCALSVFAGGFDLEAAEAVGQTGTIDPADVVDLLDALVDKSLVQADHSGTGIRYRLLETVRQYAAEQLAAAGEVAVRDAHARHFLALAERVEPELLRTEHVGTLARLDDEHENLRAALDVLLDDPRDAEPGLRLAGALLWYWELRGQLVDGGRMAARAIAHPAVPDAAPRHLARALLTAAHLGVFRGENTYAVGLLERAHEAALEAGDRGRAAIALRWMAFAERTRGNHDRAGRVWADALALARAAGDRHAEAVVLALHVESSPGHERLASMRRACEIFEELGDLRWTPVALNNIGNEEVAAGDFEAAREHLEESQRQARLLGNESSLSYTGTTLVLVYVELGELDAADAALGELTERSERLGYHGMGPIILLGHALIASGRGHDEVAATLHGAADAEARRRDESFDIAEAAVRRADHERLRARLGDAEFGRLHEHGATLTPRQALDL